MTEFILACVLAFSLLLLICTIVIISITEERKPRFSIGQKVLLKFERGYNAREASGTVVYADAKVCLVNFEDTPNEYWVFLAPDWKDDRVQLWRIDG